MTTESPAHIKTFVVPTDLFDPTVPVHTSSAGIRFVRTPDERFEGLDGFPYAPHYVEVDGLRAHYVDEGSSDGPIVLLLHGQPTWSYLYRKMIPVLADAGLRVIAWDNIGFGRSDKPIDPAVHSYRQQIAWTQQLLDALDLDSIHLFCQDWGGVFGLRIVGDNPHRFASVVAANTGLVVGASLDGKTAPVGLPTEVHMATDHRRFLDAVREDNPMTLPFEENFSWWIRYALHSSDFRAGDFVHTLSGFTLSEAERVGYDAPFPSFVFTMGPHTFPAMLPTIGGDNDEAWASLGRFDAPFLYLGADRDNIGTRAVQARHVDHIPGATGMPHERFNAGHFIQDELGEIMADRLIRHVERSIR